MGGFGSGNHLGGQRRCTVEESLVLAVDNFRGDLEPGARGGFSWQRVGGSPSIGYSVDIERGWHVLRLSYLWQGKERVSIPIRLQTTRPHFGGRRWWFTCPLATDGAACQRRVRKLYSPPGQKYFGCRCCFGLTYRSSQEAHKVERSARTLANLLGADPETTRLLAEQWFG